MDNSTIPDESLKQKIVASGGVLTIRNIFAALLSAAGNIVIVRFLGLEIYGLQSVSLFFISLLMSFSDLSISLYLLRKPGELDSLRIRAGYTLLQISGLICVCFALFVLAPAVSWWYGKTDLFWLLSFSSIAIIFHNLGQVSRVLLERQMDYRRISLIEICGMLAYYLPTIAGIFFGLKVWALIIGEICKPVLMTMIARRMQPIELRFLWNKQINREILRFGLPTSASGWVWMLSGAVNPILIGKLIGLESAGMVRLVQGICNQFSFFSNIISRLSLNVFGKIQEEPERVLRAVNQSAIYNYFLITFPTFLFTAISYWAIPFLYGEKSLAAATYMVFAVLPNAINLILASQSHLLMACGKSRELMKLHLIRTPAVLALCFALVPWLGYFALPAAETFGLLALYILHKNVSLLFGKPDYADAMKLVVTGYLTAVIGWNTGIPLIGIAVVFAGNALALFLLSTEARKSVLQVIQAAIKLAPSGILPARNL